MLENAIEEVTSWLTPISLNQVGWAFLVFVTPILIWVIKRVLVHWLADFYKTRYSKLIILDARIWKLSGTDYEIQFTLRSQVGATLHLRGISVRRPKGSSVAWFTSIMISMPQISHLDSPGLSNFHDAKLDVEPNEKETISMALRVPKEKASSMTLTAKYFIAGKKRPFHLRHSYSLEQALTPRSSRH